jgi:nicotinate-nucleotide--dimethylbenzimidazole phosphoribosyltransferase
MKGMSMNQLERTLKSIAPVDQSLKPAIAAHLDDLTKPPKSLGRLEELALRYCLATGAIQPSLGRKKIFCFAGDHGVADEGVSAYPKAVTPQMVRNMLAGGAAVNVLARHAGAELEVVDMGVDDPLDNAPGLCRRKIRRGTANIARGPAMTIDEARRAVEAGVELATTAQAQGIRMVGTGDMGIANTTPSTALFAAFLKCPVEAVTGRGTGIDDRGLHNKIGIVKKALETNKARLTDPLSTLAALGGFEIAGICGLVIGAAACRMPVVVDGFISSAGALAAVQMRAEIRDYLFFSHLSQEKGHRHFMETFGVRPILDLDMRLGEGTGAALAMMVIEGAVKIYNEMATFSSAGVSRKEG